MQINRYDLYQPFNKIKLTRTGVFSETYRPIRLVRVLVSY